MFKNKYKVLILFLCLLLLAFIAFDYATIAEAADNVTALQPSADNPTLQSGTGLKKFDYGEDGNGGFVKFARGILAVIRPIVTILTAVAGLQIAFGISDGKKTVWNWILGAGLALSFADFAYNNSIFGSILGTVNESSYTLDTSSIDLHISNNPEDNKNVLSNFMNFFKKSIILPGSAAIKPICVKLLLILFTINCSMKLAMDLISGDKIKFLFTETLKAGFYIFLIVNWVGGSFDLTGLLSNGFQEIGFRAGGETGTIDLNPDSIWNNGCKLLSAMFYTMIKESPMFDMTNTLMMLITFIVSCICVVLTSLEMFMVRLEFLTMALLTMPLLAFGVIEHFNFLTQKAIGAVFNLAMKCCVIAFIQAICDPFFKHLVDNLVVAAEGGSTTAVIKGVMLNKDVFKSAEDSFMAYLTVILGLLVIYLLTKKIPALVSALLSGQPQLAGSDMAGMAMGTVTGAATAAGVLSGIPGGGKGGGAPGGPPGGNTPSPSPGGTSGGEDASTTLSNLTTSVGKAGAQIAAGVATGGASAGATAAGTMAKTGAGAASAGAGAAAQGGGAAGGSTIGGAGANGAGSMQGAAGGGASTGSGGMPDTGSSKLPDMNTGKRDEDKNDVPDTSVNAPVDTGDDPYNKKYDQEGEGDTQAQEAPPQEAQAQQQSSQQPQQPPNGGGPNGQAQQPPQQGGGGSGSYSQSSSGGSVAGYLAKAALMSSPAGNVVEAFGKGRNLANNFDRAIHGDTKEQESQSAKLDQLIYMLSQQHYGNTQNPNNNGDVKTGL